LAHARGPDRRGARAQLRAPVGTGGPERRRARTDLHSDRPAREVVAESDPRPPHRRRWTGPVEYGSTAGGVHTDERCPADAVVSRSHTVPPPRTACGAPMPLPPADVDNVGFSRPPIGTRGYNEDEVAAFLDRVEAELARLIEENEGLREQVAQLEQR